MTNNGHIDIKTTPYGYARLGRLVRQAMREHQLTANQVADQAECAPGTVMRLANGKIRTTPHHATCARILHTLGLDSLTDFH